MRLPHIPSISEHVGRTGVLEMRRPLIRRRQSVRGTRSARERWEDGETQLSLDSTGSREDVTVAVKWASVSSLLPTLGSMLAGRVWHTRV